VAAAVREARLGVTRLGDLERVVLAAMFDASSSMALSSTTA